MFSSNYVSQDVKEMVSVSLVQCMEDEKISPETFKTILSMFKLVSENAYENGIKSMVSTDSKTMVSFPSSTQGSDRPLSQNEEQKNQPKQEDCPICMENIDTNEIVTHCGHTFHQGCLMEWNHHNTTCPMCRAELGTGQRDEKKYEEEDDEDFSTWENPLGHLFEDVVVNELRQSVKRRLNDLRLGVPPGSRFQCPCGSNISRASGHQHFQSNRHIIWLHELSEQSLRDIL